MNYCHFSRTRFKTIQLCSRQFLILPRSVLYVENTTIVLSMGSFELATLGTHTTRLFVVRHHRLLFVMQHKHGHLQ